MSLVRHFTRDELVRALDYIMQHPRAHIFISISETMKVELKGSFASNQLRLYSYTLNSITYWFAQRNYDIVRKRTFIVADGSIIDSDLETAFLAFDLEEHLTDGEPRLFLTYDSLLTEKVIALMFKHGGGSLTKSNDAIRFFMTPRQMQMVNDYELVIPEGYELSSATVKDADFINGLWPHAENGDDEQTRRKISSMPSSLVRYNGEIVAFEIVDAAGMLNNQYVMPDHRGKGLGRLVEMDLSKKMIREGYTVYKHIHTSNSPVVDFSTRSKYFTTSTLEDGTSANLTYLIFS